MGICCIFIWISILDKNLKFFTQVVCLNCYFKMTILNDYFENNDITFFEIDREI